MKNKATLRANLRIAGFVIPAMFPLVAPFLNLFAPPFPNPFPPLPRHDMILFV